MNVDRFHPAFDLNREILCLLTIGRTPTPLRSISRDLCEKQQDLQLHLVRLRREFDITVVQTLRECFGAGRHLLIPPEKLAAVEREATRYFDLVYGEREIR